MRRVGNQAAVGSKHGAGKVETLLDVGGNGGSLENSAHLLCRRRETDARIRYDPSNQATSRFCSNPLDCGPRTCDAHEAVREDGELDGVELGAEGAAAVGTHRQADVAGFGQAGLTVGLHQDGTD